MKREGPARIRERPTRQAIESGSPLIVDGAKEGEELNKKSSENDKAKLPPHTVLCENPRCGERIELDESLLSPDADTPQNRIHARFDPKLSPFSALCRHCHHFTVGLSAPGQNPISLMNRPPTE
jgi:hypothetical protein